MDKTNALSLTGGGMFDGGWTPVWLIKDEFTDTVAAGSVNGTAATPGPGTRAVVDTENELSVGNGVLALAGGKASPAHGDPAMFYGGQSRVCGLSAIMKFTPVLTGAGAFGFDANAAGIMTSDTSIYLYLATGELRIRYLATSVAAVAAATTYDIAVVLRNTGTFYLIRGGVYTTWTLIWVESAGADATTYPGISNFSSVFSVDHLRALALPAPFDTDDGIATDTTSGSVAAGTTFSHEGNALIEATITTVPSADNIDIVFRQQDASNYWICRIATGGDISLQEVVAGTPTQRGVAAGVVSNGHRVVVIADGSTIKGYSNNTLRWTYASASNFSTATAGEVDALGTGGVVSNVKTWPRTLSGTAASILNKASA